MCEKSEQICEGQGWEVITCDDGRLIVATPGDIVCHQDPNHATGDGTDAKRFKLIAAAPDLLEALKLYMASVELMNAALKDGGNVHGALSALIGAEDMANWAIAKAEGRS
jgi:hypothetical protein